MGAKVATTQRVKTYPWPEDRVKSLGGVAIQAARLDNTVTMGRYWQSRQGCLTTPIPGVWHGLLPRFVPRSERLILHAECSSENKASPVLGLDSTAL